MNTAAARSAYNATYAATGDQFASTNAYFDALDTDTVTTPPPTRQPTAPTAGAPVTVPDSELAILALGRVGMNRQAALEAIAADPAGTIASLREAIAAERGRLQEQADRQATDEWKASPEGRKAAAAEALSQQAQQAELVKGARALLLSETESHGLSVEMVEALSDAEVLAVSGIREKPLDRQAARVKAADDAYNADPISAIHEANVRQLQSEWHRLSKVQQRAEVEHLGIGTWEDVNAEMSARARSGQ